LAAVGMLGAGQLFRFKYEGKRVLRMHQLGRTFGFAILPFVYLFSVVRGCLRHGGWGVLW
jgi:hypothetical protein